MIRRFFLPLFWKFNIAIIVIVSIFGSINIYLIWSEVYSALERESEKRGLYISESLAKEIINPLIYEDYVKIQQLIDNVKEIDSTIVYIFVLSNRREVVTHTFENGFPKDVLNANISSEKNKQSIKLIYPQGSPEVIIRDISQPILNGKIGEIRIGILEKGIAQDVQRSIFILLIMVFIFLLFGIVGAFIFAKFINNPIKEISLIADKLDFDSFKFHSQPRIKIRDKFLGRWKNYWRAEDQLDVLAEKFNGMIERLENAYSELQIAHDAMLQSEKLASVGTLVAGVAHEINNPLAGIQNCIRRIIQNPENMKQNQKYLKMMDEATNKIEQVVRGLLDFTRTEKIDFQEIDCVQVIEKSLSLVAYNLEKSKVNLVKNYSEEVIKIWGSQNHLQQVIVNLILNAIDSISEKKVEAKIIISVQKLDKFVSISIEDNGVGISPEIAKKIFDPFFTTKVVGKGTGLGLSVSYKIINAHQGSIKVDNLNRDGAKFIILLPLKFK